MNLFWKRKIRVEVAGLVITEPHIAFDIRRESTSTRPAGMVTIHNLSRDHENLIFERGRRGSIKVMAGYGDSLGLLFEGSVQRVEREREDLTRKTKIALGGQSLADDTLSGVTRRSWDGPVTLRQIVRDLAADMQMTTGPLEAIPDDLELADGWAWGGSTAGALNSCLTRHKLSWYEDDGVIRVTRSGVLQSDSAAVTLNQDTGLIGAPTITDDGTDKGKSKRQGARARSLLNPLFAIGGQVTLESETVTGEWKTVSLRHHGNNWTGSDFYTELELKKL